MCEHLKRKATRKVNSDGRTVVSLQCQECGSSLAAKLSDYNIEELPPFDPDINQRYTDKTTAADIERRRQFAEDHANRTGPFWEPYKKYLLSSHWNLVRRAVLQRDPWCQKCFSQHASQAHHLSYETFKKHGFSFAHECVGVCEPCHKQIHSMP